MAASETISVGDTVRLKSGGADTIKRIAVCLRPSIDPAGEEYSVGAECVEIGDHGPPFAVDLQGGGWAYGAEVEGHTDA